MSEDSPPNRTLYIHHKGASWPALVEAQGISHLRVCLDAAGGKAPAWTPGEVVTCRFDAKSGTASIQGIVVHADAGKAWIHLAGAWTADERRAGPRSLGGFPVALQWEGGKSKGTCVDISPGGLCIHLAREEEIPSNVAVGFRPPGEEDQWILNGRVVHQEAIAEDDKFIEVGLKFTALPPEIGARIEEYCRKG